MIDTLTVVGRIGIAQTHHQDRLAHVTVGRFSVSKSKPTTTFVNSPHTNAQIDVKYWVEAVAGIPAPVAFVELKIPLAAATVGQNYAHAGLKSIRDETRCAAHVARLTLATLGFTADEIDHFMRSTETVLLELTWHSRTASQKALRSLLKRTENVFEAMSKVRGRHDVPVRNVDYRRRDGKAGILVEFKSGDQFRQYGKYDQITARSNVGKQRYGVSPEMKAHRAELLKFIDTHARNEVILCRNSLMSLELLHPSSWTPDTLTGAIDSFWQNAGLDGRRTSAPAAPDAASLPTLSPEVEVTWERYKKGEGPQLKADLPTYTYTRHRASILRVHGKDIAESRRNMVKPEKVGYQLKYDRRCEPAGDLRKLVLCEVTAPDILEELKRGLAYIQDGEIPVIDDEDELAAWLIRWKHYAEREGAFRRGSDT